MGLRRALAQWGVAPGLAAGESVCVMLGCFPVFGPVHLQTGGAARDTGGVSPEWGCSALTSGDS